jgi:hypothetical protein
VRTYPAKSSCGVYYGEIGLSQYGDRKLAELSSSSESDEEVVDLGDSDKDMDWGDDADMESLYREGFHCLTCLLNQVYQ